MVNTLNPPAAVILSWPKPNYVNPETRGEGLYILSTILPSLGILMVTARLYSRFFITKAPGFDDALAFLALLLSIALSVLIIIGNKVWWSGHHVWDISMDKYVGHRLNIWIAQFAYVWALCCVKISVLLFYRRLSILLTRRFMIATWIGITYNILYLVGFTFALLFGCQPIKAYWYRLNFAWAASHDWHCDSENIGLPTSGALSVIGDFYSALLPMLLIMSLDLPRRQKLSLYALFALAFLVVGAGIARTVLVNTVINKDYDFTWVLWEMWIWGEVELYVALLAASAPALKPFFRRFFIEPMTSIMDSDGRKKSTGYGSRYADRVEMRNGYAFRKDPEADPERIGIAYGGPENVKSREEIFVRDIDDEELETRHYELRQSHTGRKMVPTQIWKKARNSVSRRETDDWPAPLINASSKHHKQHQKGTQGHVRNFSQPHSSKSSGDTTTGLLPHPSQHLQRPTQASPTDSYSSNPYMLGQQHVVRRLSEGAGSVKLARLRAQQQAGNSRDASLTNPPARPNSRNTGSTAPPLPLHSHAQYMAPQQRVWPHADLRQDTHRNERGRTSRLEDASEDKKDAKMGNERLRQQNPFEPPWYQVRGEMQNQMYVVEKSSLHHRQRSAAEHSRSSEETLGLPRMGSTDDFNNVRRDNADMERRRQQEAEMTEERARMNNEMALIAMRETEKEIEREKQEGMRREFERRARRGR